MDMTLLPVVPNVPCANSRLSMLKRAFHDEVGRPSQRHHATSPSPSCVANLRAAYFRVDEGWQPTVHTTRLRSVIGHLRSHNDLWAPRQLATRAAIASLPSSVPLGRQALSTLAGSQHQNWEALAKQCCALQRKRVALVHPQRLMSTVPLLARHLQLHRSCDGTSESSFAFSALALPDNCCLQGAARVSQPGWKTHEVTALLPQEYCSAAGLQVARGAAVGGVAVASMLAGHPAGEAPAAPRAELRVSLAPLVTAPQPPGSRAAVATLTPRALPPPGAEEVRQPPPAQ